MLYLIKVGLYLFNKPYIASDEEVNVYKESCVSFVDHGFMVLSQNQFKDIYLYKNNYKPFKIYFIGFFINKTKKDPRCFEYIVFCFSTIRCHVL